MGRQSRQIPVSDQIKYEQYLAKGAKNRIDDAYSKAKSILMTDFPSVRFVKDFHAWLDGICEAINARYGEGVTKKDASKLLRWNDCVLLLSQLVLLKQGAQPPTADLSFELGYLAGRVLKQFECDGGIDAAIEGRQIQSRPLVRVNNVRKEKRVTREQILKTIAKVRSSCLPDSKETTIKAKSAAKLGISVGHLYRVLKSDNP
jgi:hypothetical protein